MPQNMGEFKSLVEDGIGKFHQFSDGQPVDKDRSLGLFLDCKKPSGEQMGFFFGECLPNLDTLEAKFMSEVGDKIGMIRVEIMFRTTTSFHMPGREPSLASLLDSESWYKDMKPCFCLFAVNDIIQSHPESGKVNH